jgi:hypothetical protein
MGRRPTPKGSGRRCWLDAPLRGGGQASGPPLLGESPGRYLPPRDQAHHGRGREEGEESASRKESSESLNAGLRCVTAFSVLGGLEGDHLINPHRAFEGQRGQG